MVNEENILMKALYDMDFERIKSILKQGFDVNEPYNKHGWTPYMWACKEFYEPDIIKAFIQAGGDVKSRNRNGETPFMIAAVIASGSKMFGLIYLLLKTGTLAKDSLLVFDEPENHLHPEWQIKLAKIIVTMVKNDFYVLLTSHSPTFIHALMKYGSECIERKNKVKFYLAEKVCEQNYSDLNEVEDVNRIFDNLTSPNDILYFG